MMIEHSNFVRSYVFLLDHMIGDRTLESENRGEANLLDLSPIIYDYLLRNALVSIKYVGHVKRSLSKFSSPTNVVRIGLV